MQHHRTPRVERACQFCGEVFSVQQVRIRNGGGKFCSKTCQAAARKHPTCDGPTMVQGYVMIYIPSHPDANRTGRVHEHRLIASQTLGRPLAKDEVVHHINGVRRDNRPENLQVLTQSEHFALHRAENERLQHLVNGWSREHAACIDCGTTEREHVAHGRCGPCRQRYEYWRDRA